MTIVIQHMVRRVDTWVRDRFGEAVATDRAERAIRLVEEAVELAQAEGVPQIRVVNVSRRVYDRPVGEAQQEFGGVGVCLLAYASAAKIDPVALIMREIERIEQVDPAVSRAKHAAKTRAGITATSPLPKPAPEPTPSAPVFTEEELRVLYDDERTLPWQPNRGYVARRSALKKLAAHFNR